MPLYSRNVQTYCSLAHAIKRNQCPGSTFGSLVYREKKAGFSEEPRHPAMYLLDTRWKQMHNAMRVREGTVTITGSHPHSRWSLCAQVHSILS